MNNMEISGTDKEDIEPPEAGKKIQRSVKSMLKQMEISNEEIKYRMENFDNADVGKEYLKNLKCTKCNMSFQQIIHKGKPVGIHPLLGVLMCDSCCEYYGDGNFSLDSEGEDKYCRWCGEGGTIFACSKCICGFCNACIEKHFGVDGLEKVRNDDDWVCYFCNNEPLWYLRSICFLAKEAARNKSEQLKKEKEGRNVKRKRRKKENLKEDQNNSSLENSSSGSSCSKTNQIKRKRLLRRKENIKRDESSSNEDEKENYVDSKKKLVKSKKLNVDKEMSSESEIKSSEKILKISCDKSANVVFENKKVLVLEKLKSIWKLTQTITEVGLNSSRERLKTLSKTENFKTLDRLKREHDELKSCMNILVSSLSIASNSVDSIKEDLTFENTKDEREIFQIQETKLKRFAKKYQEESNIETSMDSDEDSGQKGLDVEKRKGIPPTSGKENSVRDSEKIEGKKEESDVSSGKESKEGKNKSMSLLSESSSEEVNKNLNSECERGKRGENNENRDPNEKNDLVKPLLKVKSFAKMLDENVYDKNKTVQSKTKNNPIVIDLYDIDTDESENESQTVRESLDDKSVNTSAKISTAEENKLNEDVVEKIETSEHQNENKDSVSDKREGGAKKKGRGKCLFSNKNKNSVENKSACNTEYEKNGEQNNQKSSDSETTGEQNLSESSVNTARKELLDGETASKTDEEISSSVKSPKKKEEQDSFDDEDENSFNAEQKRTRNSRKQKNAKRALNSTFERFKRKRERFLKSKEKCQLKKDSDKSKATRVLESSDSESEQKKSKKKAENSRKKRVVASSDEENKKETKESKSSDVEEEKSEEENQNQTSELKNTKQSSDETSSDDDVNHKMRTRIIKRKRKRKSIDSDSSEDEKPKRSEKKEKENSSESSEVDDKKKKKGRKNIKKILKKDSLQVETKEALKNEEERKKRLKERQELLEKLFPQKEEGKGNSKQIILDYDPGTKEPLVKVHKKLAKKLKPHQVKGVRFMWDNCFESVQKLEEDSGSGCILAHCMGLGKTLQVITLIHTVMSHDLGVNTVLIVCPLSTVSNWVREFEMWLENVHTDPITLFDLVKYKRIEERQFYLENWHQSGGVLVLSYDLFRTLTKKVFEKRCKKKKPKSVQIFEKVLLDPGPDLVICDEGHLLKNEDTALSKSVSRIKTSRRIVLTGTPLQNNLIEYHCMVQFVKPNILGTKKEFCNRFVNPINNGQFEDSTELDVKVMKRRSHVLHSMLEGFIQRFDYSVLTPFLPEKHEYVLSISLTETQAKAYVHFIDNLSAKSSGSSRTASLFNDYHNLQRIWTHPRTVLMQSERESQKEILEDESEDSIKDFVVSSEEETNESESEGSDILIQEVVPKKRILRSNANDPEVKKAIEEEEKFQEKHWWDEFYDEKAFEDLRESNKLVVLFSLLKYCGEAKDKVLIFSQSLYSLDLIEYFLSKVNENVNKNNEMLCGHHDTWILGSDYFRLDGTTKSELRTIWCKYFNEESNTRARLFLISTKAGGLGINLYGANRVVLFDASWNPSHDLQSIFRVYRFGQKKTCYIYRFLSEATMEEKIYERQVTKLSLAHRVVDEHQIERHYTMGNLQELYTFEPKPKEKREVPKLPKDSVLADLLGDHKDIIVGYHEHDSLLENKEEEELTEDERKAAWKEYEEEKAQKTSNYDLALQQQMMLAQQAQFCQGEAGAGIMNPAYWNQMNAGQNFFNPMFLQSNIPLEALQRGMRVGVTPLPNESLESYYMRIFTRENWMLTKERQ